MAIPDFSSSPASLPVPMPRSPPMWPDLYGMHRNQAELHSINLEIALLQEELLALEGLQSASTCCKEVDDFVGANPDPLVPMNRKVHRSFRFWKQLCLSWISCCSSEYSIHLRRPHCCSCNRESCWWCCCHPNCHCCCRFCCSEKSSCRSCCVLPTLPPLYCHNFLRTCSWSCPKYMKVCCCPKCNGDRCLPCNFCLSRCLCS